MSNLIITVIAIGVMAIAVGMLAYYLGSTYENSQSSATANTIMNEADQLSGMWKNYLVGNLMTPASDWSELIDAGYLDQVMEYPPSVGTEGEDLHIQIWPDDSKMHYYAVADLGDPALANGNLSCNRVLGFATGGKLPDTNIPAAIPDFSAATLNGVARFTCGPVTSAPQQNPVASGAPIAFPPLTHNIFIYRLS